MAHREYGLVGTTPQPPAPADDGLLAGGFAPGHVDDPIPLDTSSKPAPTAAKAATVELNLVADFPKPASWDAAKEKKLIAAKTWFPHTLDFQAVAGTSQLVRTSGEFMLKIVQAKGSINRLNFFSHGKTGLISIQGEMLDDGSNVLLVKENGDPGWTQVISGKPGAIMDPFAGWYGTFGENSGSVKITVGNTDITLDDVRGKFASDAVIWLYLCHGASDPLLFQEVSNTFQVTVKGFTKATVFCAPNNFPQSRKHAVIIEGDPIPNPIPANPDFRGLDSHANVKTASPKKPP